MTLISEGERKSGRLCAKGIIEEPPPPQGGHARRLSASLESRPESGYLRLQPLAYGNSSTHRELGVISVDAGELGTERAWVWASGGVGVAHALRAWNFSVRSGM